MAVLRKIILGLIPFAVEMGIKKSQAPKNIALKAAGGVLFLAGAVFGLTALHQYLNTQFEPLEVNLIFAAGFALLALICFLTAVARVKKHERENTGILSTAKNAITGSGIAELPENIKDTAVHIGRVSTTVKRDMHRNIGKYLLGAAVFGLLWGARTRGKKKS